MKLSIRLTLVFTGLSAVLISSLGGLSWWLAASEVRNSIDDDLYSRARLIERIGSQDLGELAQFQPSQDQTPPATALFGGDENGVQFFNATGEVVGDAGLPVPAQFIEAGADPPESTIESISEDGRDYRLLTILVPDSIVRFDQASGDVHGVQFYRDTTRENASISTLALQLFGVSLAGLALVAGLSWFVGRWLAQPLRRLTSAAERLADVDVPLERIELARSDEVGRLADSFNRLLSALEVGREQQRRLVADASHELRTPLTSLRMRAEFLAAAHDLDPDKQEIIDGAVVDVEQLSALVSDLIDLAADVTSADEPIQQTRLGELVSEVADRSSIASGRRITVEADDTVTLVRRTMIRRAVQNLVDNAVKYSPATAPILIRVAEGRIEVLDAGPGIAAEDARFVFDRFFRSPKARSRPGNGIGLAIVQKVADAHNGHTWVGSSPSGGARVGFSVLV